MRLKNKVAVITGAASGMGLAMAKMFVANGAKLVLGDWNEERLFNLLRELEKETPDVTGLRGDISNKADAEALVELAIEKFGRIDILCNNAGVMDYMEGVAEMSDEIWTKVLGINLNGPMYATRKAIPYMQKNGGGAIINTASTAAVHGGAAGAAYTTSKHALIGLTKNTAYMYAKEGIRCNAICPGATATNIQESMPEDKISAFGVERLTPFHALSPATLEADDIANVAMFLGSDESKLINGAIITADDGWAAV